MSGAATKSQTMFDADRYAWQFPFAGWMLLLAGCISVTPHPHIDPGIIDVQTPLGAQDEFTTQRPTAISPKQPAELSRVTPAHPIMPVDVDPEPAVVRLEVDPPPNALPRLEPETRIEPGEVLVTGPLELDLVGPKQRSEGSRAEFVVRVMNRSNTTLSHVRALVSFDKALVPKEASQDHVRKDGILIWDLGTLSPMERVQLQIEFECRSQARRACVTLDVKAGGDLRQQEEACVEVIPVPGPLELTVNDAPDPLDVGALGIMNATVSNIGLAPARRVIVETIVPNHLTVVKATVTLDQAELPLKFARTGNTLTFEAVDRLLPNGRLTYSLEVKAVRAGICEFQARLTSSLGSTPITSGEPTIIDDP